MKSGILLDTIWQEFESGFSKNDKFFNYRFSKSEKSRRKEVEIYLKNVFFNGLLYYSRLVHFNTEDCDFEQNILTPENIEKYLNELNGVAK